MTFLPCTPPLWYLFKIVFIIVIPYRLKDLLLEQEAGWLGPFTRMCVVVLGILRFHDNVQRMCNVISITWMWCIFSCKLPILHLLMINSVKFSFSCLGTYSEGQRDPVYAIIVPVIHYKVSVAMNTFLITWICICFISSVLTLQQLNGLVCIVTFNNNNNVLFPFTSIMILLIYSHRWSIR